MPMFNFAAWLRQMFPRTQRAGKKTRSLRRTTLQLEQLEDRIVLAYSLTDLSSFTGANGANPTYGSLIQDASGNLFGTSQYGGANNVGTVFEVVHGSSAITDLASFNSTNGQFPTGGLVEDASGNLFGTTSEGGASGFGTVFEVFHNSGAITDLASFNSTNGKFPYGGLVEDASGNLFGTSFYGGASNVGTVFEVLNGSGAITDLASFNSTNGSNPIAGLVEDASGNLFGTTSGGGASNHGTVFEIVNGSGAITDLASFNSTNGAYPVGALIEDASGDLFGTTQLGGAGTVGTVFEVVHNSGAITDLASFNGANGSYPLGGLVEDASGNLFGTANNSANNDGTVFEWVKSTGAITTLASFNSTNGASPYGGLVEDASGNLFGTTYYGGANGDGTVFELANVVTVTPTGVTGVDGSALSGQVATLDYGNDTTNPATFTATITWSDNTQTNALVTQTASGAPYVVSIDPANAKTFAADGVYTYTVSVVQNGVTFTSGQGTATVTEAAPFSVLASFTGANGKNPYYGSLVQDAGGNLFGTTISGGANGYGTVFEIVHGSSVITDLASFTGGNGGANPYGGLVEDASGNLFGTTYSGGANNGGTVFEVARGSGFITVLASFNPGVGANPIGGLVEDAGGNLFGTTSNGGAGSRGTVFEVVHNSGAITDLASFNSTNGATPYGSLVEDAGGNLFGTTYYGGANGYGTVFEVVHNSGAIMDLASFNSTNGANPIGGLVEDAGGNLFGTTSNGGAGSRGTVFEVVHNSGAITDLASFNSTNGATPLAGLVQDANGNLFGTSQNGGANGFGTVFEVVHNSGAITDLATFNGTNGANPIGGLVEDAGGNLFGTTYGGGANGFGTVFEVAPFVVTASGVSGPESTALSGQVATFIDGANTEPAANFTATITWSDNTTSQGVVTAVAGVYVITLDPTAADAKTYAEEGGATYTVTVTEQAGQVTLGTLTSAAANVTVTDPPLTSLQGVAATQSATENQPTTVTLATFQDAGNPSGVINSEDYTADVNFGDGIGTQFNVPIVVTYNNGTFTVTAAYTFTEESASGTAFTVTTQLHHEGATDPAPVTATVAVSDPAVMAKAGQAVVNAPAGGSTNLVLLATFTDPAGAEAIANYSATVDWGDGTVQNPDTENTTDPNANIFIVQSGSRFLVEGTHIYATAGQYTIATTIHHDLAPDVAVQETAKVASPAGTALSATGGFVYTTAEGVTPPSGQTVATFTDLGGAALDHTQPTPTPAPGVYAAAISWGDGSAADTTATITVDANGLFTVAGSHRYADEGTYTVSVLLQRTGAPNVTVTSTAVVADAAISVADNANNFPTTGTEGASIGPVTNIATITDNHPGAFLTENSDFNAVIFWGDGTTSQGAVSYASSGNVVTYRVDAPAHTYAEDGRYTVQVQVRHDQLAPITSNGQTITIGDVAVNTPAVPTLNATENVATATNLVVATFGDPAGAAANEPASDFAATINWGDSTPTDVSTGGSPTVQVVALGGGQYQIVSTPGHTYVDDGTKTITVVVTHGGLTSTGMGAASVADRQITGLYLTVPTSGNEGAGIGVTGQVAIFNDPAGAKTVNDVFTAFVNWGDGSTSAATLIQTNIPGQYTVDVASDHTYAEEGNYTQTVTVQHGALAPVSVSQTIAVGDVPIGTPSVTAPTNVVEGGPTAGGFTIATFSDAGGQGQETAGDFTATIDWGDGIQTTGTVAYVSTTNGVATYNVTAPAHTYAEENAAGYTITVSVTHGTLAPVSGTAMVVVADAALTVTTHSVNATEGQALSGVLVATFTDADPRGTAADYSAQVTWGDNIATTAVHVVADGTVSGQFDVLADRPGFVDEGASTVAVMVTDHNASGTNGAAVAIADAPLMVTQLLAPAAAVEGVALTNVVVATFTDAAGAEDVSATIQWGNGTGAGTIVDNHDGTFSVTGSHTYAEEGTTASAFAVTVTDLGGATVTRTGNTIAVADATLTAGTLTVPSTTESATFGPMTVFHFTDANTAADAADFTATVHTGDAVLDSATNPSQVQVVATGGGGFDVKLTYTYAEELVNQLFSVQVTDVGGSATGASSTITVADATLTAGTLTVPTGLTEGGSVSGAVVFSFTDANTAAAAGDFTATVNTGDATLTSAANPGQVQVVATGGGFNVLLSYTYAEELSGTLFSVSVADKGGAPPIGGSGTITVTDAALTVTAVPPPTAVEGLNTGTIQVATFTDADPAGTVGDYTATIHWGDGSSTTGTIVSLGGGTFGVTGSHTYAEDGTQSSAFSVTVTDAGGATKTGTGTIVSVTDAPLTAGSLTVPNTTEGAAFGPVTVFHFTDANTTAGVADFTATVNTGAATLTSAANPTQVQVVATGGGGFDVKLSYTYAEELVNQPFSVHVADVGGQTTGTNGILTVADQQISTPTITGLPATASDGVSLGAIANFATFTDPAVPEAVGDYTATIHWGDGTTSVGTVSFVSGNTFQVSAPAHTYTEGLAAGYNVTVTVQHDKLPALTSSPANIVVADVATHIQSINVSKALLTDADAGSTFRVVVSFNEPMDTTPANAPTIGFSQAVDTTLTNPAGSWNAAGTVYTFSYTVANANVTVGPIDVTITGGTDANGNAQNPTATTLASAFSIDTTKPTATTVASPAVIADATTSFTLTATYSKAMDVTVFPGVTFSTSTGGILALLSEAWTNSTTFQAVYSVANTHVTIASVTASLNNARDTHGNLQGPPSTSNTFRIDTQDPTVTAATPSAATITDAQVGSGAFTYAVTFSEAMDTTSTPTIGFSPSIASTLTFASGAWSAGNTVYTATYNVADANTTVGPITVSVTNARDAAGNGQRTFAGQPAGFRIDTQNPTVTAVTPSATTIADAQVGSGTFTYAVTFSKAVDSTSTPVIAFSPSVASTLTFASGAWSAGNTVYTATYNVADANTTIGPITVSVTNVKDTDGNAQVAYAGQPAGFTIDTLNPAVTTVTPSVATITDAQVGSGTFTYAVTFSEAMSTTSTPAIAFSPSVASTLTFASGAWSAGNTVYTATYNVADANTTVGPITVSVTNAKDADGNAQVAYAGQPAGFTIDTQNPTVASIAVSRTLITDSNSNVPFTVTVTYSKAMDATPAHFPTIAFSPSVSTTLTFASGAWSAGNTVYTATYNVAAEGTPQTNVQVTVTGGKDTNGNTQTPVVLNNAFSVSGSAPTVVWSVAPLPTGWTTQVSGDFNGDGKTDLAAYYSSTGQWLVSLSTGTGFLAPTAWSTFGTKSGWTSQIVGDFTGATLNGHAVDDIANFYQGQWWVSVPTGLNTFSVSMWSQFGTMTGWSSQIVGDFNGDGQADIANYYAASGQWWVSTSTGHSFTTALWSQFGTTSGWTTQIVGDFNGAVSGSGHRIDDIANYYAPGGEWWLSLSNAPATSTFSSVKWATFGPNAGYTTQVVGDFNGDGKDDIANFHASDATWFVSASTGTSFTTTNWGALPVTTGWTSAVVGDFNRDGKADVASFNANTATWYVSFANPAGTGFTTKFWVQHATVGGWNTHMVGDFSGANYPDLADFQDSTQKWWVNA